MQVLFGGKRGASCSTQALCSVFVKVSTYHVPSFKGVVLRTSKIHPAVRVMERVGLPLETNKAIAPVEDRSRGTTDPCGISLSFTLTLKAKYSPLGDMCRGQLLSESTCTIPPSECAGRLAAPGLPPGSPAGPPAPVRMATATAAATARATASVAAPSCNTNVTTRRAPWRRGPAQQW